MAEAVCDKVELAELIQNIISEMAPWKGHWQFQLKEWDQMKPLCPADVCKEFVEIYFNKDAGLEKNDFDGLFQQIIEKWFPVDVDAFLKAQVGFDAANEVISNPLLFDAEMGGSVVIKMGELKEQMGSDYSEFCAYVKEELRNAVDEISKHFHELLIPIKALEALDKVSRELSANFKKRRRSENDIGSRLEYMKSAKVGWK
jgi:hypothetical protein